jgi:hypothetical protein
VKRPKKVLYHDLDFLCGTWTKTEADEFDASLARQRTIDPDSWRFVGRCQTPDAAALRADALGPKEFLTDRGESG